MASAWAVERGEEMTVRIRFTPAVARLVREAEWHPTQELEDRSGGSVVMTIRTGSRGEVSR